MRRFLSLLSLLALLLALASGVAAQGPAPGPATALVYVPLTSHEDLARFEETGLPAYARMTGREVEYLLVGATPEETAALSRAGLSFRILDPDTTGAAYYFAFPRPGWPAPRWEDYGRLLLDDGFQVLLRTSPNGMERLVQEGIEIQALFLDPKPLRPWAAEDVIPAVITPDPLIQSMIDQVTTATVRTYNRQLAGELPVWVDGEWYTIPTRYTYSGIPIQKTTRWAGQHFAGLGLDVEYHQWGGSTYPNVIGEYTGLTNPDDIFIICAHVDDVQNTPGADDNGSGSTAVLIAADILTQYRWGCTLRFALWTGEEQGLLGSYAYAQRSRNINENILDVVNLDMIAWNTPGSNPDIDLYARASIPRSVALAQLFDDVVEAYNLNLIPQILTSGGGGSDNYSFWQFNYSAILGIEDNNDFNPYYHSPEDTPAHTDLLYFTEFVKAALATFAHASGCLIPGGLGAVDGHVTDGTSGEPISRATVRAQDPAGHTFPATTDHTGYYTRTLLAGTYTLTVSHPQYESAVTAGVTVLTGTVTTVDFALRPRGRLWGYVTDYDNGFPLAATLTSDDGLSAQSDPTTGYYELYLDEGFHIVTATAEDYFPAAAGVNLSSGQSTRQDFRPRAQVSFIPKPVHETVLLNTTYSRTVQILNRRASPYPFTLYEVAGGLLPGLEALWPGPDGFGYTGETTDFDWIELRGSGTPITGLTDDSFAGPFPIGFAFPFYGTNWTQFYVSSNGFISFGSGSDDYSNDCPLPNVNTPNNIVAPMWDDLYPNYTSGGVYYQAFDPCPIGSGACLVVEYDHWAHCCDPNNIAGTFEAVLLGNGSVLMQFLDGGSEEGSGSTTAVEGNNAPANYGLTYACNAPVSLPDGLSICYVYPGSSGCVASDVPWLGENPTGGTVPAGSSLDLTLFFSATASAGVTRTGDYYATLVVNGSPKIRVPMTMTVVSQPFSPTASFASNTPVCLGEEAVFTDTSNPGFPPADAFLWDFGDGITSTIQNPTHLYAAADTYSVTFRLCNSVGCDEAEDVFVVQEAPEAGFTYSVSLLTVAFTNTSRNATAYLWDLGDGFTSTVEHPTHTYAAAGLYTVTLTATGRCGEDTATMLLGVEQPSWRIYLPLVFRGWSTR